MKRILVFLLLGVLLFSFVGCEPTASSGGVQGKNDTYPFKFSYYDEHVVWKKGSSASPLGENFRTFYLVTSIEYLGEESFVSERDFQSFQPTTVTVYSPESGYKWEKNNPYFTPSLNRSNEIYPGQVGMVMYGFEVTDEVPAGKYHIKVTFLDYTQIFENAIEIVE